MRTIAIINQKGGCGKTTTAINLAAVLASRGRRTLLIDLDPQSHCAAGLAVPIEQIDLDIGDAMLSIADRGFDPDRLLWRVSKGLDLAPSRTKLAGLEATRGGLASAAERERRLGGVLEHLRAHAGAEAFEYCIIDCPPSIGLLTYNALSSAGEVIIPVETGFFSLQGATRQLAAIRSLGRRLGTRPSARVLATMHDERHALARELRQELIRRFGGAVIPVTIRFDTALREAASMGQPVIDYDPASAGAQDYGALADWLDRQEVAPADDHAETVADDHADADEAAPVAAAARSETAPPEPRRARAIARPLRPVAGREDAARDAVGALDALAPGGPEAEARAADPVEAVSRVEDLCRRAQALQQRLRSPDRAEEVRVREARGALRLVEQKFNRDRRDKSVSRLFGVRRTERAILFVQPIEEGLEIRVAGDFNGWSPTATLMHRNEALGVHELTLPALPGRLRYRLIIDGAWRHDRFNPSCEPNEFGELNSIIERD